jgi:hypothetical protein
MLPTLRAAMEDEFAAAIAPPRTAGTNISGFFLSLTSQVVRF